MSDVESTKYGTLLDRIVDAAEKVYAELGGGFDASFYRKALAAELDALGARLDDNRTVYVSYRNTVVGTVNVDLVVSGKVMVQIADSPGITDVFCSMVHSTMVAAEFEASVILCFRGIRLESQRFELPPPTNAD